MSNIDFGDSIDAVVNGSVTQGVAAPSGSPERAAKALDLEQRSGVPAPVIELNIEQAEQDINTRERGDLVRTTPALQSYINSSPMAAQVSSDDYSPLAELYKELETFVIMPATRIGQATIESFDTETPLGIQPGGETEEFLRAIGLFKDPNRIDSGTLVTEPVIRTSVAALDLIGRGFWAAGAGAGAAVEEAVAAANELIGQPDVLGDPKRANREVQNFVNFWLLRMGVQTPTLQRPYFPLSKRTYEFLQRAEELRPKPKSTDWQRDPNILRLENQAVRAEFDAAELNAAVEAAIETSTRERAPQMLQTFVEQGVGDRTVGVNARALQKLYDEMGVAPAAGDAIFGFDPDIARKIQLGLSTGTDVEVSLAAYIARVDPKVHEQLLPVIRSKNGMTIEEVKELQEEMQATIESRKEGDMAPFTMNETIPADPLVSGELNVTINDTGDINLPPVQPGFVRFYHSGISFVEQPGPRWVSPSPSYLNYRPGLTPQYIDIPENTAKALKGAYDETNNYYHNVELPENIARDLKIITTANLIKADVDLIKVVDVGPTETAIVRATQDLHLAPLADAEALGMTKPEFALYSKKLEAIQEKARAADVRRVERQAARELTSEWRTTYAEEITKAQAEFDARRDVIATRFIRSGALERGTGTGEPIPLDIQALGGVTLPKGMAARGGVNPDDIAGLLGYQTGAELVADVKRLVEDQGRKTDEGYRKSITEVIAKERARERFGDMAERQQAVIDLVADPDVSKLLFDDLRVMQKQGEGQPLNRQELEAWAHREFRKLPILEAKKINKWIKAVSRNGRKAEMALLRGKTDEAFKYKGEQWLSMLFLQQALRFNKELPKHIKLIKQFSKKTPPKTVNIEFHGQIQRILSTLGVEVRGNISNNLAPLNEFVAEWTEYGYEPTVAAQLMDPFFYRQKLWELPVRDFQEVMDSIKSLKHVGSEINKVMRNQKKQELADAIDQIEAQVITLPFRTQTDKPIREWPLTGLYRLDSYLVKMEEVFDDLDLQNPHGAFNEMVFTPLRQGEYFEDQLRVETQKKLEPLKISKPHERLPNTEFLNPMSGSLEKRLPYRITRGDLTMWALNFGNLHNRRLLVDTLVPFPENVDAMAPELLELDRAQAEQKVLDYINRHMREEDWKFVEGLWSYFEWLKPMVDALYERTSGVVPDTVEGSSFMTAFGEKKGGYTPVIIDSNRSAITILKEARAFNVSYHKATTANSYTKPRHPGSNEPLLVIGQYTQLSFRIRSMLHDIALREPILNAQKILYNKKVRELVSRHYGQEYVDQFHGWLRYIANHYNEEDRAMKWLTGPMRMARINMSIVALGLNPKTILTPNIGPALLEDKFLKKIATLGLAPTDVAYYMEPQNWAKINAFALEHSGELRSRVINLDRDISDAVRNVVGMPTPYDRWQAKAAEFGMALVGKMDRYLATFTWIGTYDRAIKAGRTHEQAVVEGDKAVSKGYGSASPMNLAALYRQSEFVKLLTVFQQYMNLIYNRNRSVVSTTRGIPALIKKGDYAGAKRDFVKVMSDSFAWFLIPAFLSLLYVPDLIPKDEDEDSWGKSIALLFAMQLATPLPFIRDIAASQIQGLPTSETPILRIANSMFRSAGDLWDWSVGDDPSEKWLKYAIQNVGYLTASPTGSLANSAQYIWNVSEGEDELEDFWDFFNGMVYGKSEPGKR